MSDSHQVCQIPPSMRFRKKSTASVNRARQREAESEDAFKSNAALPLREARPSSRLTSTLDEREEVRIETIHLREHEAVGRSFIYLELTTRYQLRGSASSLFDGFGDVGISVNDQRWYADGWQLGTKIRLGACPMPIDKSFQ